MRKTLVLGLAMLALVLPGRASAAPANDAFAAATAIGSLPFSDTVVLDDAATEVGEPQFCNFQSRTVWYAFTAVSTTALRIDNEGSDFGTVLSVFRSSGSGLGGLSLLGCGGFGNNALTLTVDAGATIYVQAGTGSAGPATLRLNVTEIPPPPNDDFADAVAIESLPFSAPFDLTAATTEAGEPTGGPGIFSPIDASGWYAFTAPATESISVSLGGCCWTTAVYTGDTVGGLTQVAAQTSSTLVFKATAGTTYRLQIGRSSSLFAGAAGVITVDRPPAPSVTAFWSPFDPSVFDTVSFFGSAFDPAMQPFDSWAWDFGDGGVGAGQSPTHRYAADGDYAITVRVRTSDGRVASSTQTVIVRTHDVAIVRLTVPQSASAGQTRTISVGIANTRRPETVRVDLLSSSPNGWQVVGSATQEVPVRSANRTTQFAFNYTFTAADALSGKVTFKAVASIVGARDALPADNEAVALPTKISR